MDSPAREHFVRLSRLVDGTLYIGGKVYAIDVATGNVEWAFFESGNVSGSIALHKGMAYFGTDSSRVYAVDIATHQQIWRAEAGNQVFSTPAIGPFVYVNALDGNLHAFDGRTGSEAWTAPIGLGNATPTIANGLLYTPNGDGSIQALDPRTGRVLWSHFLPGGISKKVAVADGRLYVANDRYLFAMGLPAAS